MEPSQKQPKALYLLFFTELWERFGFYTLLTVLILYMTKSLEMTDKHANLLYAAFTSLLYLTPMIGGYLADKYLGFQRSIIIGGFLFIGGYLLAALPNQSTFFIGLSLLICANGFFKPNVSSLVGDLYHIHDPRRDGGFTLFYMGINIGALIPPLIAGYIVTTYGWHAGFILAAAGMTIGQVVFLLMRKCLHGAGAYPHQPKVSTVPSATFYILLLLGIILSLGLCHFAFLYPAVTDVIIEVAAIMILLVTYWFMQKEPRYQRKKMIACLILIVISIGFWAIYNQTFTSLMLFADRNMSKHILGLTLTTENTQFFNPFFIVALSPILNWMWIKLDRFGLNPSTQVKFALGIAFMCAGFLVLTIGAKFFSPKGMTSPWWLVSSYLFQTIGELLISPIGLAMITVLCPKHLVGMMMGVWFFSQAAAFATGGMLANIAAVPAAIPVMESSTIYAHAFLIYGEISLAFALLSFALLPMLNRLTDTGSEELATALI